MVIAHSSHPQYRVLVEKDVPMRTRDGVTLRADVYRPHAGGRFPVLLSRLPYDKNSRPRPAADFHRCWVYHLKIQRSWAF
jgi:predicted acyl esterase